MEKVVRSFKRRACFTVILLYTCLPNFALAAESCLAVYSDPAGPVQRSAVLRKQVQDFFQDRLDKVIQLQDASINKVMKQMQTQWNVSEALEAKKELRIGGLSFDISQVKVPAMAHETLPALEAAFNPTAHKFDAETRMALVDHARDVVARDPYFQWLGQNHKLVHHGAERTPLDVGELLIQNMLISSGPTMALPVRLGIVRLYEVFDPNFSVEQASLVRQAMDLHQVRKTLEKDLEILSSDQGGAGSFSNSGLAPSLVEAKINLRELTEQQVKLHGALFPKSAYDRAIELIQNEDTSLALVIARHQKNKNKFQMDAEPIAKKALGPENYRAEMEKLKKVLRLPAEFPTEKLDQAFRILDHSLANGQPKDYALFLAQAFADPSKTSTPVSKQIQSLRTMIEYIESMVDFQHNKKEVENYYYRSLMSRKDRLFRIDLGSGFSKGD